MVIFCTLSYHSHTYLTHNHNSKVYTYGKQPVMPELAKYQLMEEYNIWQEHYESRSYDVWAISDIYQIHELRFLQVAFQGSKVRSLLFIPLHHRQQLHKSFFKISVWVRRLRVWL